VFPLGGRGHVDHLSGGDRQARRRAVAPMGRGGDYAPADVSITVGHRGRRRLFLDRVSKHILAAMSGALINARLDRVLGSEFISRFLDDAEAERLEGFRQDCLYLGQRDGKLHIPAESITSVEAACRALVRSTGSRRSSIQPESTQPN
jgi:hypothetical protein